MNPVVRFSQPPFFVHTQGKATLSLFLRQNGTLFGTINNLFKVPLEGIPSTLKPSHIPNALKTLSEGTLFWNGRTITFRPRLLGGGCCQSTPSEEHDPLLGPQKRAKEISSAPPAEEAFPPYWSVPPQNRSFVGREPLLAEMKKRLMDGGEAPVQIAASGLGGVGKTSLVIEYLHRNKDNYELVWWISGEQLMSSYRELGESLGIVKPTDTGDVVLQMVKHWLERNTDWILVFDNIDDVQTLAPFLPSSGKGHILTTSRNPHAKNSLMVDVFSPDESIALLTHITGQTETDTASELAETLGRLPLALTQAAAYMKETATSFSEYLTLFQNERKELWKDEKAPKDYPDTVGTTWNISVKRIKTEMPGAIQLLYRSAYLGADNIPRILLRSEQQSPIELQKQLHILQKYSFFSIGQKEDTYSVHRLVQATARDQASPSEERNSLEILLHLLVKEWKFDQDKPETWPKAALFFPHLATFSHHGKKEEKFLPSIATFLNDLGLYSGSIEIKLPQAIDYHTQSLAIRKNIYGEDHPNYATGLNNLGMAYLAQGDLTSAIDCYKQSQEITKRTQGEESPFFATGLNNLGGACLEQGNLTGAIDYFTRALEIRKRVCGKMHPDVAQSLNNLGGVYSEKGNIPLAIECYTKALAINRKVYGEKHPDVANSLNNLARAYKAQGEFPKALNYYSEALSIRKKVYGETHPKVSESLNSLGTFFLAQANLSEALNYFTQSLAIDRKVYGEQHPHVAASLHNLGAVYHDRGELSQAIIHFTQALEINKNAYGEEHPTVASTLNSLGAAYKTQGKFHQAIECLEQALVIRKKLYGEEHLDVATTLDNLGLAYQAQGNLFKAINHSKQALAILKNLNGEKHPSVATCLNNLGTSYLAQGNLTKALGYFTESLEIEKSFYGEEHPNIATALHNLGMAYKTQRKFGLAIDYYSRSLAITGKACGEFHPDVATGLNNLAGVYYEQGNIPLAIDHLTKAVKIMRKVYGKDHPQTLQMEKGLEILSEKI